MAAFLMVSSSASLVARGQHIHATHPKLVAARTVDDMNGIRRTHLRGLLVGP